MRIPRAALCLALLVAPAAGRAAPVCNLSASPLVFGAYNPLSPTPLDGATTITYACEANATVTLSAPGSRFLSSGANALSYELYTDASRTQRWGDGTNGAAVSVPRTPGTTQTLLPVYGRIFAQQDVAPGTYAQTLTVTFSF